MPTLHVLTVCPYNENDSSRPIYLIYYSDVQISKDNIKVSASPVAVPTYTEYFIFYLISLG